MKGKSIKVSRLSPNEEAQLVREELQRRRKLRLQQVREQERSIALHVRREVQERRERELQSLATGLRDEWQKHRGERIQTLERVYKENLRDVGQGHRSAKENEPNREALALKKEQNDLRAAERHQKALQSLITQRHAEADQRNRHIEARKKALTVEKERAAKIAGLPQSAPDPIESVAVQTPLQPKISNVLHYSITHHHVPETAVDREADTEQPDAQEAAASEARRSEELEKEEALGRQEQLERARLRGNRALCREKGIQDNARLMCELERLQQAELQRRRHMVNNVPAQIFQPLYRHDDLRAEQQRELENAFQDLCTEDKVIRDDLVLRLVSEPLPLPPPVPSAKTDSRPESHVDLDVTLEPKETPYEEEDEDAGQEPVSSQGSSVPAEGTSRVALRRLLDRIRTQKDQWSRRDPAEGKGGDRLENAVNKDGSPSGLEWQQASSLEEGTVGSSLAENSSDSKMSEDSIVTGPKLEADQQTTEMDLRESSEEELKMRQEEEFDLLQEQQRSLELQLEEAQLCRQRLQDALHASSGICSVQETSKPQEEMVSEPSPEVKVSAAVSDSVHIQKLQQYQQRLLKQNRLHQKTIHEARRNLEEYKQTLKMRYAPVAMTAAQTPSPSEGTCAFADFPRRTLSHVLNTDTEFQTSREAPAVNIKQSHNNIVQTDPAFLIQPPLPGPSSATSTHPDTHVMDQPISHSVHEDGLALIPHPAASTLLDKTPSDGTSERHEVPLLPPAVFLEYMRSRRSQAPPTHLPPGSQQGTKDLGVLLQEKLENSDPCREAENNQQVRDRLRKQKDALHALLRAQHAKSVPLGMHDSDGSVIDASVKPHERSNEPILVSTTPSQSHVHTQQTPLYGSIASSGSTQHYLCESTRDARVNPPVSCPPRTLQILLHDFEQHKLSTIEEVDTPVNVTMDTAAEVRMESSSAESSDYSVSYSLSMTSPTLGSGSSQGQSSEVIRSEDGTHRPSKLSWKEMLQLESATATDSTEQHHEEELELVLPHDGASGMKDFLSSTTLSTGSYFSSELDPNFNITDSSLFSNGLPGASLTCSSSSNSLQHIIDKYTEELDKSLRSVHTGDGVFVVTAPDCGTTAFSICTEQNTDAGTLQTVQPPTLPLQCNLEDSNSMNTTVQDTFQSLSPEITNNDMTDCSVSLQLGLNPPLETSNTNTETTASDWLDCGLSQHVSTTDDQSSSPGFPQWEWTLGSNSELRTLEASVSHKVEVSGLENVAERISALPEKSFEEPELSQSTTRSCSQLKEVKHSCQDAYAKNREKAKEFKTKTLEKLRAKRR
ncbi:centrosomal protein of 295 kDa isoform X2 [Tachysurus vachellii]|uniref:centrosomal protein of 295 kDa isoform X2 n=1 Tax=Tachysurus vachellii TaxID=175792 RepID=UPI00296B015C|nr:centrosomal protein of 295 kDa isoform X2 [Tachysurus vachellii]